MRAAVYYGNRQLEIEDVPEPSASDGRVKVQVSRNGICGTDLHEYFDGPIFIPSEPHPLTGKAMPLVIGHEFSGVVTDVGRGVSGVEEGDRVTIEPIYRCGACRPCQTGRYNLCTSIGFHGLMADGGMAEYTVVPPDQIHKLPDAHPCRDGCPGRAAVGCLPRRRPRGGQRPEPCPDLRRRADRDRHLVRPARPGPDGDRRRGALGDAPRIDRGARRQDVRPDHPGRARHRSPSRPAATASTRRSMRPASNRRWNRRWPASANAAR